MSPSTSSESLQGHFLVATTGTTVYCRVVGLATMNNSISVKELLEQLHEKGIQTFVFDLVECTGFDSTFMGILLGFSLGPGNVVVVNTNASHRKLLREVGIHRIIQLCDQPVAPPDVTLQKVEQRPVEPRARVRQILDVHELLVRQEPKNAEKFGAFLAVLRAELGDDPSSEPPPP